MKTAKPSARPMVVRVALFFLLFCLLVDGGAYWLLQILSQRTMALAQVQPPVEAVTPLVQLVLKMNQFFWPYFVPASVFVTIFFILLTALSLRRLVAPKQVSQRTKAPAAKPEDIQAKAEMEKQMAEHNRRLYLHLIAVMQKEGRLLDFFSEDLTQYNDGQIGAAVRNIHESCKKALQSHVAPQAVLTEEEGAEITVDQDFDPNTIKLVGNVTGHPPFKGVVQHRGWRARKLDLPTFSGRQSPDIIAPAEVEVK